MDHLRIKANKCDYKEKDRRLKEKFINDINDDHINDWDNKGANHNQTDKWNHQWASVGFCQKSSGTKIPKSYITCNNKKQRVWCDKNHKQQNNVTDSIKSKQKGETK